MEHVASESYMDTLLTEGSLSLILAEWSRIQQTNLSQPKSKKEEE
jgi:hypothetical protein